MIPKTMINEKKHGMKLGVVCYNYVENKIYAWVFIFAYI